MSQEIAQSLETLIEIEAELQAKAEYVRLIARVDRRTVGSAGWCRLNESFPSFNSRSADERISFVGASAFIGSQRDIACGFDTSQVRASLSLAFLLSQNSVDKVHENCYSHINKKERMFYHAIVVQTAITLS